MSMEKEILELPESMISAENISRSGNFMTRLGRKLSRDLSLIKRYVSSSKAITIASLLFSCILALLVLLQPSTPVPQSFSIPLFIAEKSTVPPINVGHKLVVPYLIGSAWHNPGSHISWDGCRIPQYVLNASGVSNLHEIVHENKQLEGAPIFFKRYKEDIQKYFPSSHIDNFEECWYGRLSTTDNFSMLALMRIDWDHIPDQKDYFNRIVNPIGILSQNIGMNLMGEGFAGISQDDHKFYCQGFLGSELYFLLFSNHPSCEPLDNLMHAIRV